jgi:hypothetical protein
MRARPHLPLLCGLLAAAAGLPIGMLPALSAEPPTIAISQVYGGGGNSGAPYNAKFVELFNRGAAPASIAGWSIQYASATGTAHFASNVVTLPDAVVPAGGYYLIGLATGINGAPLPTPDTTGTINPAATSGKVILAATGSGIACNGGSASCGADQLALIVDLVGYGSADFYEGLTAAPALSNTTAALRRDGGCSDTNDNGADFTAEQPAPRNSASPINPCASDEPTAGPTDEPTAIPTDEPSPTPTYEPTAPPTDEPTAEPTAPTFTFEGFLPPLANPPATNSAKAGSSVVLHFSLGGYHGLDVIDGGHPQSARRACTGDTGDDLEVAGTPGASGLSYDPETGIYTYAWKTDRAWAGTCRQLVLRLVDSSRHTADFAFR